MIDSAMHGMYELIKVNLIVSNNAVTSLYDFTPHAHTKHTARASCRVGVLISPNKVGTNNFGIVNSTPSTL